MKLSGNTLSQILSPTHPITLTIMATLAIGAFVVFGYHHFHPGNEKGKKKK